VTQTKTWIRDGNEAKHGQPSISRPGFLEKGTSVTDEANYGPAGPPEDRNDPIPLEEAAGVEQIGGGVDPAILDELERLRNPRTSWIKTVGLLVVSLVLFLSLGWLVNPALDILVIIAVLFVHEMGHFIGMRLFGYRDVRMFFIPFFGAAVSGRDAGVESYQRAIVVLLGPLPGLCLALLLILLWGSTQIDVFRRLSLWFAIINGFNLLPVFPMDGGRLLQILLFSRNRYGESLFNAAAGFVLLAAGFATGVWVFYVLGGVVLLATPHGFRINTIAQELKTEMPAVTRTAADEIPLPVLKAAVERVKAKVPDLKNQKTIAGMVQQVWERMHVEPPDVPTTLALFLVYVFSLMATLIGPMVLKQFLH
jgi:Zn-dependent protease